MARCKRSDCGRARPSSSVRPRLLETSGPAGSTQPACHHLTLCVHCRPPEGSDANNTGLQPVANVGRTAHGSLPRHMANAPIHPTPTRPDQPIPSRPIQLVQLDLSLPGQTHLNPQDPYLYLCCPHPPSPKNHTCQILPLPSRPPHPPRTVPSSPVQSPATPATVSLYGPPRPMPAAPIPSHSVHPTTRMRECMKIIFFVKDATTPRSSNSHEYCMQLT